MRTGLPVGLLIGLMTVGCGQVETETGTTPGGQGTAVAESVLEPLPTVIAGTAADGTAPAIVSAPSDPVRPAGPEVVIRGSTGESFNLTFPAGWLDGKPDGKDHRLLLPGQPKEELGTVAMVSLFPNTPEYRVDAVGTASRTGGGLPTTIYDTSEEGFPPMTLIHIDLGEVVLGIGLTNSSPTIIEELLSGLTIKPGTEP